MADEIDVGGGVDAGAVGEAAPSGAAPGGAPPTSAAEAVRVLKWRGKEVSVPESKVTDLAQMGYDYHQKLQAHAQERQTWEQREAEYQRALQEVDGFLSDRNRLTAYLRKMEEQGGKQGAAAGAAADAMEEGAQAGMTPQQVERLVQERVAQAVEASRRQVVGLQQRLEVKEMAQGYRQELLSHIKGLTQEMPELQGIRDVADVLMYKTSLTRPQNIDAARETITNLAREYAAGMREYHTNSLKTGGAGAPPVRGIEPPGGAAAMPPAPPGYKGKITDPAFKNLITEDLMRLIQKT